MANELVFFTLATLHNLQLYLDIMRSIRHAILIGAFPAKLRELRKTLSPQGAKDAGTTTIE